MTYKTVSHITTAMKVEGKEPANTTYNVIDTLIRLDRPRWDAMVHEWEPDPEGFIKKVEPLPRTVAYTYWYCIWFGMEHGYPIQFHPGNAYHRKNPEQALDWLERGVRA